MPFLERGLREAEAQRTRGQFFEFKVKRGVLVQGINSNKKGVLTQARAMAWLPLPAAAYRASDPPTDVHRGFLEVKRTMSSIIGVPLVVASSIGPFL